MAALHTPDRSSVTAPAMPPVLRCLLLLCGLPLLPGSPYSPIPMNVLLHQSVTMPCTANNTLSIHAVSWKYERNRKPGKLLDTSAKPYHTYPSQFKDRLEGLDDLRTLKIYDLRMEDSGMFNAEITFKDGDVVSCLFNITVYEPVPGPSIQIKKSYNNGEQCNVTLRCSVPTNSSSLSYSWSYRDRDSDYRLYHQSGDTIQISLRNSSWDSDFLCIVQNPVDKKNYSVSKICNDFTGRGEPALSSERSRVITKIAIIVPLAVVIGVVAFFTARKCKERKGTPPENEKREPQYIQVTASRADGDDQIWNNALYNVSPPQKAKAITIYAEIKHPDGKQG